MSAEVGTRNATSSVLPHLVDVCVYFVVLNLAALLLPQVISESVGMSVVTAVLLKLTLEAVIPLKKWAKNHLRAADSATGRVVAAVGLWVVLAGSKFLVLKLEEWLLGDAVSLGGFFEVTGLIIALMLARSGVRAIFARNSGPDRLQ